MFQNFKHYFEGNVLKVLNKLFQMSKLDYNSTKTSVYKDNI